MRDFSRPTSTLTDLERRVLFAYGFGRSRFDIARDLNVSRSTVGRCLTTAKEKLCAVSLAHAALLLYLDQNAC